MNNFDFGSSTTIVNNSSNISIGCKNINQNVDNFTLNQVEIHACNMRGTRFNNSRLFKCIFHKMILGEVVFTDCDLTNSNFYHATFDRLVFINCDLSGVSFKDFDDQSDFHLFLFFKCNMTNTSFANYEGKTIDFMDCYSIEDENSYPTIKSYPSNLMVKTN